MTITFRCSRCTKHLHVDDHMAGQKCRCGCGAHLLVPPPAPQAGADAAAVVVACPGCARCISLAPHEMSLLIECAQCGVKFVPSASTSPTFAGAGIQPPGAVPPANQFMVDCPTCRATFQVPESSLGRWVECPECRTGFAALTQEAEPGSPASPTLAEEPVDVLPPIPEAGGSGGFAEVCLLVTGATALVILVCVVVADCHLLNDDQPVGFLLVTALGLIVDVPLLLIAAALLVYILRKPIRGRERQQRWEEYYARQRSAPTPAPTPAPVENEGTAEPAVSDSSGGTNNGILWTLLGLGALFGLGALASRGGEREAPKAEPPPSRDTLCTICRLRHVRNPTGICYGCQEERKIKRPKAKWPKAKWPGRRPWR